MRKILLHAIEAEGSTLGDGTYRNSLNAPGSYQIQHRVHHGCRRALFNLERLYRSNCSVATKHFLLPELLVMVQ